MPFTFNNRDPQTPLFLGNDPFESSPSTRSFVSTAPSSSSSSPSPAERHSPSRVDFRPRLPLPSPLRHQTGQPIYLPQPQQHHRLQLPPMSRSRMPVPSRSSSSSNARLPAMDNRWALPPLRRQAFVLPRQQSRQPSNRPASNRPPPEMIDLTLSSPIESRVPTARSSASLSSDFHGRKKKRKIGRATPVILLDDKDDSEDEDGTDGSYANPASAAAANPDEKPKKLAGTACIICMEDEPVNLSVTPCGHMFCHKCLFGAIKATLTSPNKVYGKCPVCRGKVAVKDIVVLSIKKMSKGKERAV